MAKTTPRQRKTTGRVAVSRGPAHVEEQRAIWRWRVRAFAARAIATSGAMMTSDLTSL